MIKELRVDGKDPLFDKTGMLYKEFPSDFRQIRYFTLLIVQSAPLEIKGINLLEQQISEIIKNAVKHGNKCDPSKKVKGPYAHARAEIHTCATRCPQQRNPNTRHSPILPAR